MHPCTKQSDSVQIRTKIFLRTELLNAPYQSLLRPKGKRKQNQLQQTCPTYPIHIGKDFRGAAVWLNRNCHYSVL